MHLTTWTNRSITRWKQTRAFAEVLVLPDLNQDCGFIARISVNLYIIVFQENCLVLVKLSHRKKKKNLFPVRNLFLFIISPARQQSAAITNNYALQRVFRKKRKKKHERNLPFFLSRSGWEETMAGIRERPRMKCHKSRKIEGPSPDRTGPCEWKQLGADIKVSQKNRFTIRSMKLESQRYGSLVESYHGNIRDRTGQKSKVKKERHDVNITITNRELPSSRWDATLWSTSIFPSASLIHQFVATCFLRLYKGLNSETWCILLLMWNGKLKVRHYTSVSLYIYL